MNIYFENYLPETKRLYSYSTLYLSSYASLDDQNEFLSTSNDPPDYIEAASP